MRRRSLPLPLRGLGSVAIVLVGWRGAKIWVVVVRLMTMRLRMIGPEIGVGVDQV